jgi:hypothetical protein
MKWSRLIGALLACSLLFSFGVGAQTKHKRSRAAQKGGSKPPENKADTKEESQIDFEFIPDEEPSPEWLLVVTESHYFIFISTRRIVRRPNNIVRAWFKSKPIDERDPNLDKVDDATVREVLSLVEYRCDEGRSRLLSLIKYDSDGKVLDVFEPEKPVWGYVTPESIGEAQMKKACAIKGKD